MEQARRSARGFARSRKRRDLFFEDECEAEAVFIVSEIVLTNLAGILEKFPSRDERSTFYRMSVGYGLKSYFAHRAMSTLAYLKKRGIRAGLMYLEDLSDQFLSRTMSSKFDGNANYEALEHAIRTDLERTIVELYSMGNSYELIASKTNLTVVEVRIKLRTVRRRLGVTVREGHRMRSRTRERMRHDKSHEQ